jgi:hypothetical protein
MTDDRLAEAVSLLSACRDAEALEFLDGVVEEAVPGDAATALMLKYTLYAGDLKDWRRADEALAAAIELEPEYARYNEEAEGIEEQQPIRFPKILELSRLVSKIYAARYGRYRQG